MAEVITHEIPEDDVPSEYLDNDEHLRKHEILDTWLPRTMLTTRFYSRI